MKLYFENLTEIKGGLSKKKVFRKFEKNINKIIIDFSEDTNDFYNFIKVYEILKKINISIPKIYEIHNKKKIVIMEDFGDYTFQNISEDKKLYELLKLAIDNLIVIENTITNEDLKKLEKYKYEDLKKEISEFVEYYLPFKNILDFPVDDFYILWESIFNDYNFEFNSFVHKDFEFINLIFLKNNNLHLKCGIIDFQSAFLGFKGWDLFSVLENPRFIFTKKYNEELIKYFYDNVSLTIEFSVFKNQYYLLNLARQTRLLGRWIKLFNLGYQDYLKYISPTKKRIISCLPNIQDHKLKSMYERIIAN